MSTDDPTTAPDDWRSGPSATAPQLAGPPAPGPAYGPPGAVPTTDRMAIISLVCGVVSVLAWLTIGFPPSTLAKIISLVCGTGAGVAGTVLGLRTGRRIQRAGGALAGSGIARTGLVLGIVGSAMCAVILVIIAVAAGFAVILAPLTDT